MQQINKAELLRQSRKLSKQEMMIWLRNQTGTNITSSAFSKIMHDTLPYEQDFQTKILEYLKTVSGAFVWKAAAGPYSRHGIPDVCAIIDGHFFGFEIKRPYIGVVTKLQEQTINKIRAAGGTAAVVSFREQVKEVIDQWRKSQTPPRT